MMLHFVLNNKKGPKQKKLGKRAQRYAKDPARHFMNHWRSGADGTASATQSYVGDAPVETPVQPTLSQVPHPTDNHPIAFNPAMQAGAMPPNPQHQQMPMQVMAVLVPSYNYPMPPLPTNAAPTPGQQGPEGAVMPQQQQAVPGVAPEAVQAAAMQANMYAAAQFGQPVPQPAAPAWPVPINYLVGPNVNAQGLPVQVVTNADNNTSPSPDSSSGTSASEKLHRLHHEHSNISNASLSGSQGGVVHSPDESESFVRDLDNMLGNELPEPKQEPVDDEPKTSWEESFPNDDNDDNNEQELLSFCFTSDGHTNEFGNLGDFPGGDTNTAILSSGRVPLMRSSLARESLESITSPSQMDVERFLDLSHLPGEPSATGLTHTEDMYYAKKFSPLITRAISTVSPLLGREIEHLSPHAARSLTGKSPALARAMHYTKSPHNVRNNRPPVHRQYQSHEA